MCDSTGVPEKKNGCAGLFICDRKEYTARANNMENTVIGMLPYPNFIRTHAQAHKIRFHNSNRKYSFDSSFTFIHNSYNILLPKPTTTISSNDTLFPSNIYN